MEAVRVRRRGLGRPRTRPGAALAGKAYSSAANRACLRKRGIKTVIPGLGAGLRVGRQAVAELTGRTALSVDACPNLC
jgi:hypothetical protein